MHSHTNYFSKFNASNSRQYGGKNAALIVDRLEYWFKTQPGGFYKFLSPCNHPLYRENDSWQEELDIHPRTFNRALKKFCAIYLSRTKCEDALEKLGNEAFQGMPYLRYYDRHTNQNYFLKNYEYKKQAYPADDKNLTVKGDYSADEPVYPKNTSKKNDFPDHQHYNPVSPIKSSYETTETLDSIAHGEFIQEKNIFVNKKNTGVSGDFSKILYKDFVGTTDGTDTTKCQVRTGQSVKSRHYIAKNTSVLSHARTREKKIKKIGRTAENLQIAQEMVKAWNYATNDRIIEPTNRQIAFLLQALKDKFEGSLNKWRDFCRRIGLSKFLMRKKSSWFCLNWVLIFRNMEKIILGKLGWDAPEIISSDYQEKLKINNDQLVVDEANPKLREFKIKLRERLGEGDFNYLMKSSFHLEEKGEEIIARVSYETGDSLSRSYDKQRAFGAVTDNLNITSFKIIGPGCSDPTHRYHDPNRVHFEYPYSRHVHKIKSLLELEVLDQKNVGDLFQAAKNALKAPILVSVSP